MRLSVPSGYGQLVMSDWLIAFKRLYPDIVLDVMFENRVEDLMRDEVDIAVRVMSEPPQNLVARDMGPVRYVACASPAYARSARHADAKLDELRIAPLITAAVVGRQIARGRLSATTSGTKCCWSRAMISENFLFLRQAVLAGLGVGIVPDYVVQDDMRRGDVVTALDEWRLSIFGTHMYMLYMPNRHHTRATRRLSSSCWIGRGRRDAGGFFQARTNRNVRGQ